MIWKQDGDPPFTRKGWLAMFRDDAGPYSAGRYPTARDLWFATAHETADMICQIIRGDAHYYGLGRYRSLFPGRTEVEYQEPFSVDRAQALANRQALERERRHVNTQHREQRLREKRFVMLSRKLETLTARIRNHREMLFMLTPGSRSHGIKLERIQSWQFERTYVRRELRELEK